MTRWGLGQLTPPRRIVLIPNHCTIARHAVSRRRGGGGADDAGRGARACSSRWARVALRTWHIFDEVVDESATGMALHELVIARVSRLEVESPVNPQGIDLVVMRGPLLEGEGRVVWGEFVSQRIDGLRCVGRAHDRMPALIKPEVRADRAADESIIIEQQELVGEARDSMGHGIRREGVLRWAVGRVGEKSAPIDNVDPRILTELTHP